MVSTLLSVIFFIKVALSHTPPLRVLEVHINGITGMTIHYTESKIHISYSENYDLTLFFYYFYMPSLPTLAHTIAKGSTFSISSPFDVTKLQKNCLDVSSTGSFPFPMSMDTHIHILYHPYGDGDSTWI
jgi:hypothetical protein